MTKDVLKDELIKMARDAFEHACTLKEDQRIEVYLNKGFPTTSDVLEANDEILYNDERVLCYTASGHNYLEDEIKTWIDYARIIQQPTDETPLPEPTDIEKSIRDMVTELATEKGVNRDAISSYEVFANMPVDLLGTIEQEIIEYWWSAKDADENGKSLAMAQIEEAIA